MAQFQQGPHLDTRQGKCQIKHWLRRNWITVRSNFFRTFEEIAALGALLVLLTPRENEKNLQSKNFKFFSLDTFG
jgi:hypothetical protein